MATTAESFRDGLRWVGRFLRMAVRRAAIMAVLIALFVVAVWWTTRESVSDCGEITDEQRELMTSLGSTDEWRFRVEGSASCVEGRYSAPVVGLSDDLETATAQLLADGLELDVEFIPFYQDRWRRCFRFPDPAFERIELNVWSNRAGEVDTTEVTAPEDGDACDFLRY